VKCQCSKFGIMNTDLIAMLVLIMVSFYGLLASAFYLVRNQFDETSFWPKKILPNLCTYTYLAIMDKITLPKKLSEKEG
jgi:hypothetical protein